METPRDPLDHDIKTAFSKIKRSDTGLSECPVEETLAAYAEGRLSRDEVESTEQHMVSCTRCTDAILSLSDSLKGKNAEAHGIVSDETLHKVKGLIRPRVSQSTRSGFSSWLSEFGLKPAWAMASVFLIVAAYTIYNSQIADGPTMSIPPKGNIKLIAGMPSDIVTRGAEPIYEGVELKDGGILRSGDRFRIEFSLESEGFAYLISVGSTGTLTLLYPTVNDSPAAKLTPHSTVTLPAGPPWYQLDENAGDEVIYLITSAVAIEDIHRRTAQLNSSQISSITRAFPATNIEVLRVKHE